MTSGNIADIQAVRSVGTQNTGDTTQWAIEAAVAAGGGTYVIWGKKHLSRRVANFMGVGASSYDMFNSGSAGGPALGGLVCVDESAWNSLSNSGQGC